MRLPLLASLDVSPEQRPLYDDIREGIESKLQGFHCDRSNGCADRAVEPLVALPVYAHVLVAELGGLPDDKLATIVAGQRPSDLTPEEAVAYDVASALVSGGVLPELTYHQSVRAFGEEGTAEIISLVGLYCMVSVTLNGFDVPVPEVDARTSSR
jgi:4-carboxymuconolactone decarboxylase